MMVDVPRALRHAVAVWKYRVCQGILSLRSLSSSRSKAKSTKAWKVLFALDLLLFGDLKDTKKAVNKRRTVAPCMELMEGGSWACVWSQVGGRRAGGSDAKDDAQAVAERAQQPLEAHEMSLAAAAALALLAARIVALPKKDGGSVLRGAGGVIRRLVGRIVVEGLVPVLAHGVGRQQYGLAAENGGRGAAQAPPGGDGVPAGHGSRVG